MDRASMFHVAEHVTEIATGQAHCLPHSRSQQITQALPAGGLSFVSPLVRLSLFC